MTDDTINPLDSAPDLDEHAESLWRIPWKFAVHGIVGTAIFLILAVFAIALDHTVQLAEKDPFAISSVIIYGLKGATYALFGTDLAAFAVFLWKALFRMARAL